MITELNENNFDEKTAKGVKLVEFYTDWCGYCQIQNEILNDMNEISLFKVNGEKSPVVTTKFGVNVFPTFLLLKIGKEINRYTGLHSKYELMNILVRNMK